ncbi:branched-subunit amino acid ABC-type transport system permease component [Hypnocyclicus thermotrophus]|uniref:Branched-subunit amino acid ABC-type transport system permease component n=1 Tax=Hypnocyclicus thermotrophus TaxID=1627895 RepID=A0AA46I4V1_9FUSO|nr:branched-chain amino acid ABC transporter permease [Hypnocyclicus thermotrophus]TDT66974.1 branched-subunit amino acid ABC-type transport system permease component [Hypnocyclicus thermotrophus]
MFIQQLINGLSLGSIYALIALGYTMVYGILKLINFAHGEIYMIGTYIGYYFFRMTFVLGLAKKYAVNSKIAVNFLDKQEIISQNPKLLMKYIANNFNEFGIIKDSNFRKSITNVAVEQAKGLKHMSEFINSNSIIIFLLLLIVSMFLTALVGIIIEKLAYKPLRNASRISVLLTALGVSIFIQNAGIKIFGGDPKAFPQLIPSKFYNITDNILISNHQIIIIFVSIILMILLEIIVHYTKVGKAMRAVSFDKSTAELMGIDVNKIISFTFAIGSALAAAAGILIGMRFNKIDPLMGMMPGIKAFVAAVLGGIGSIPGAVIGGLIMGISESLVVGYISSTYRDAIAFAILIVILLIKPSGIFGKNVKEKV